MKIKRRSFLLGALASLGVLLLGNRIKAKPEQLIEIELVLRQEWPPGEVRQKQVCVLNPVFKKNGWWQVMAVFKVPGETLDSCWCKFDLMNLTKGTTKYPPVMLKKQQVIPGECYAFSVFVKQGVYKNPSLVRGSQPRQMFLDKPITPCNLVRGPFA